MIFLLNINLAALQRFIIHFYFLISSMIFSGALLLFKSIHCNLKIADGIISLSISTINFGLLQLLHIISVINRLLKFAFNSVQFSCSVVSDSLRPHEPQHARPPCPSPTPRVCSNSRPSSRWCHPAISSSVVPFSPCPQSLPASGSFTTSQLFTWGGQSIGVSASASVLPMNTQDWSPLGRAGWISLQSKGLSRVFSNTTVQKHQFFGAQLSSQSNSHIHTWPLENHSLDQMDLCWQSNVPAF